MHSLETLAKVNSAAELRHYFRNHPPAVLVIPEHVKRSPDYSQVSIGLFEEVSGMEQVEEFFVDSSGFGSPGEPALTYPRFLKEVQALISKHGPGKLYSILTGVGQFKVYVTIFKDKRGKR